MSGITGVLDPLTERVDEFSKFDIPPKYLSSAIGGIIIGEAVSAIEGKFVRGWLKPTLLMLGGLGALYAAGSSNSDRVKLEGAIIGGDMIIHAFKELIFNKDEVVETAKKTVEAIKNGNAVEVLSNVTHVPSASSIVQSVSNTTQTSTPAPAPAPQTESEVTTPIVL